MKTLLTVAMVTTLTAQSPIDTRVIEREPYFYQPATHCDVPRYRWQDVDGVIVVRPVDDWDDRAHYLHQIVENNEARYRE